MTEAKKEDRRSGGHCILYHTLLLLLYELIVLSYFNLLQTVQCKYIELVVMVRNPSFAFNRKSRER